MLRLLGCVMIAGGCMGLGCWYRGQFVQRLEHLRTMSGILEMMMSDVRYSKATLPECCRRMAGRVKEPYGSAFEDIYSSLAENTGESFGEVFRVRMKQVLAQVPVYRKEKELFLQSLGGSSFEDSAMQLRSMEQYNDMLKTSIAEAERETAEKSRMALGLGAMGGLLLIIVLL